MSGWKQGDMFSAGQECRDCFDLISSEFVVGIHFPVDLFLNTIRIFLLLIMFFVQFLFSEEATVETSPWPQQLSNSTFQTR